MQYKIQKFNQNLSTIKEEIEEMEPEQNKRLNNNLQIQYRKIKMHYKTQKLNQNLIKIKEETEEKEEKIEETKPQRFCCF